MTMSDAKSGRLREVLWSINGLIYKKCAIKGLIVLLINEIIQLKVFSVA